MFKDVQELRGQILLKEYYETIERFNLLKTREVFITLIQSSDLDKLLPFLFSSEENRQKFSDFFKISYNEANKQSSVSAK